MKKFWAFLLGAVLIAYIVKQPQQAAANGTKLGAFLIMIVTSLGTFLGNLVGGML